MGKVIKYFGNRGISPKQLLTGINEEREKLYKKAYSKKKVLNQEINYERTFTWR